MIQILAFMFVTGWLALLACGMGYFAYWILTKDKKKR